MSARKIIAGNWKMHHGPSETRRFLDEFSPTLEGDPPEIVIFPPSLSFGAARESTAARETGVSFGVQNVHWETEGALTGEVSAPMAAEAGATHVLVGHSERRHVFGESDEEVSRKVAAVLAAGLTPVVCVGETIDERRAGHVEAVIVAQLDAALEAISAGEDGAVFWLAYEPVWAIGTGETATPEDAAEAHGTLRRRLREALGDERAAAVPILYGGSVKPGNVAELLAADDVDGVLVGGASLDPDSFARIAEAGASPSR